MNLKVLSTLAVMGAMPDLTTSYERSSGTKITADFAPTNGLLARLRAGETADVAILTSGGIDELTESGVILADSRVDIAVTSVGIAVRAGAPKPDIASADAFKSTLLEAKSIAYSRIGASGVFFAELIKRLGIEKEV